MGGGAYVGTSNDRRAGLQAVLVSENYQTEVIFCRQDGGPNLFLSKPCRLSQSEYGYLVLWRR